MVGELKGGYFDHHVKKGNLMVPDDVGVQLLVKLMGHLF